MVEAELSLRDILQLKPGDVVAVDLPGEVSVQVEGTPLFRGAFGVARGRNSIKVTQSPWADHKRASSQGKVAANGVGKTP
jgi:flagellar motor switch protein FliM